MTGSGSHSGERAWSSGNIAPPSASTRPPPAPDEAWLRQWLRDFSTTRPRWGWRRAATELRRAGHRINNKRIQRLWRAEGLKVPYRKRKKPHRGIGVAVEAMCPIRPNVLWALDFQFDTTVDRRTLRPPATPSCFTGCLTSGPLYLRARTLSAQLVVQFVVDGIEIGR